jgi:hypothetical protein
MELLTLSMLELVRCGAMERLAAGPLPKLKPVSLGYSFVS